jgi:hypothetical protein
MTKQEVIERYISLCQSNLESHSRVLSLLRKRGICEQFLFTNFRLGYSSGNLSKVVGEDKDSRDRLGTLGILRNGKECLQHRLIIPITDENKAVVNLVAISLHPQSKHRVISLNEAGIFNQPFLGKTTEIVCTEDPIEALLIIQQDVPNTTFLFGSDEKYASFMASHGIRQIVFAFDGRARLFYELTRSGISARRVQLDQEKICGNTGKEYLQEALASKESHDISDDRIQEIENGFLFLFPHLSYRVIGNFSEATVSLRVNIKAYTDSEVFVDSIDLYKNRDRQNFIYNLMDRFSLRDQIQLESDLHQIIEVIEKHRERKQTDKKKVRPELTDHQKEVGLRFLSSVQMIDELEADYTELGYVRERKNKILLYLVMTSRLMDNPLHSLVISRSGAGKSLLVEITEQLCPPEDLHSVSDLTSQALYYFGQDDLKHKFIVVGEKEGTEGSDYPLRELISKKSITKAIPMKDPASGQIKTVSITVNGPVSLVETTTNGEINPENLNRCFVLGIDESEEQTRLIHDLQRRNYTLEGQVRKRQLHKILEKHIYAQRLLRKILVVNPFAEFLSFPSSKLKTRRDHEKFLRLINAICFLNQFQRKVKTKKLDDGEPIEYIECTLEDYAIAYELLSDGVLDHTLDDLPSPARKLLELTKKYLYRRAGTEQVPVEKIIFERKDIREYTSWSFAQVRNNFRILRDYEYIQLIKAKNGLANQYRLNGNYSDLDFLNKILSPDDLRRRMEEKKTLTT